MIEDANKEELIEQYLQGELSGVLLQEFNERLASDEKFKNDVDLQMNILRGIKLAGRKQWSLKLDTWHDEMVKSIQAAETEKPAGNNITVLKNRFRRKYFLVAASIIGLIILSGLLFTASNNRFDSESVFLAYYKPYAGLDEGTRSSPADTLTDRKQAFRAYSRKSYPESIRMFKILLAKGEDETVLFYLGNAYLSNNMAPEAENAFKNYLGRFNEYKEESEWYLSLSYIKQEKLKEARKVLEEVAKENNDHGKQAIEILKKM